MKRSQNVRAPRFRKALPMATSVAISISLVLSGCSPAPREEAQIYRDADECLQVYPDQGELCQQVFGSAQMDHLATAPRFLDQQQCEEEFGPGNCESAPEGSQGNATGGSWFMPMMMGYMMGNLMGGRSVRQAPVYSSSSRTSPLRDKVVTANGDVVGNRGDRTVRPAPSAFQKASAPTRVTQSGGFGRMAQQKAQASRSATRTSNRSFGG
ncbi:DUF1190 domain-containing protein [Ferrimonas balearica]|uniref:DUF1190 domain-containing protein n=1 Tax=Ferrimonas balearica TaxID=44012 RepID=UPI001C99CBCF|nr:DUF1190 domain-containing protein [Ferrimonas balearica]MBY5920076.1 DUF1190 domain-containing protein [Ferrimonas balearica]MBY5997239.1 DUF1190 domain-containing protein [Ferrimonas balearica]